MVDLTSGPQYGPTSVSYILEVYRRSETPIGEVVKFIRSIEIPLVNSYDLDRVETTILTWTLGEFPVREFSGVKGQNLVIRGRSGIPHRLGRDARRNRLFASGTRLFREFSQFLKDYANEAAAAIGSRMGIEYFMVLRALWERDNLF